MKQMLTILLLALLLTGMAIPAFAGVRATTAEKEVLREVNRERERLDLDELVLDEELMAAAEIRAQEIMERFSHTRPDGAKWSTVSDQVYAENLAMGHRDAEMVMADWMRSKGHRRNILRARYTRIGICSVQDENGVRYWVQEFGL